MSKAVIGFYEDVDDAREVVDKLVSAGFSRDGIHFMTQHEGDRAMVAGVGGASRTPSGASETAASLTRMGVPRDEASAYVEGIRRGGTVVALVVPDDNAANASKIMEGGKAIDISERSESWRHEGWEPSAIFGPTTETTTRHDKPTSERDREGHIELVEEDVKIGKRREETGGVRVRTHVVEEPVEEDIRLREEQVHVERRPVDRPASKKDLEEGLREEEIERRESREEPVVSKEARVTEEIDIGKETTEHVETIRDTERRTEAEIEDLGTTGTARTTGTTARGTDIDETPFRQHYQTSFAGRGYDFDHYLPAYRYGAELARSSRFRNKGWDDVMPEAQKSWESRNPGTWNDYMDAVREGFVRSSGRSMARGR